MSPPGSRALEYAGCFCCHPACSAFLAISYNGALERRDVIKPLKVLQLEFHLSGNTSRPAEGTWKKPHREIDDSEDQFTHQNKGESPCFRLSVGVFRLFSLIVTAATLFYRSHL